MRNYRVYISGPMTGYPDHNRPAFEHAQKFLEAIGMYPENPHKIDALHIKGETNECMGPVPKGGADHGDGCYLRGDIKRMVECQGIYMLEGWQASQGARLELINAMQFGMDIYFEGPQKYDIGNTRTAQERMYGDGSS